MSDSHESEHLTRLLRQAGDGDSKAAADLLPLVYDELRRLARARLANEAAGNTLQPTALVHEAYLRLLGPDDAQRWDSRGHFFGAAARAMRRILIERARGHARIKRGGDGERRARRVEMVDEMLANEPDPAELLAIDDALVKLEAYDTQKSEIVMLRYFAGLTIEEIAAALGLTVGVVKGEWSYARAWLHRELTRS
ncbi:MAG: ECF-type sigma factor [Planctomycetota bacterium]|nr:ECF-type sigma factor [Planctomycetota bacterium]